jgi:hypothetical protein
MLDSMKTPVKAIMAGVLVLLTGWLAFHRPGDKPGQAVPARTKAKCMTRVGNQFFLTGDPVLRKDTVGNIENLAFPPEDCRARAEAARDIVSPSLREEMTRRVVQEWAALDSVAAIAWAADLPDENESRMAMLHICTRVADDDPATAIRLATDHDLDQLSGDFIGGLVAAAREWVDSQPEGELRDGLTGPVVFEMAKSDPSAAARMVTEKMGSGEPQIEAAISVLHQWVLLDPQAAASWVENFPDGDLKERARKELPPRAK